MMNTEQAGQDAAPSGANPVKKFMSKSEYAAHKGWNSPSTVTNYIKKGFIVLVPNPLATGQRGQLVDVEKTDQLLADMADPSKDHLRERHAQTRVERHVDQYVRSDAPLPPVEVRNETITEVRLRREASLAGLAEMELAERAGKLVQRQGVTNAAFATSRVMRDAFMGAIPQLSAKLANKPPSDVECILRDTFRALLESCAKLSDEDLRRATAPSH